MMIVTRGLGIGQTLITRGFSFLRRLVDKAKVILHLPVRKRTIRLRHIDIETLWIHGPKPAPIMCNAFDNSWEYNNIIRMNRLGDIRSEKDVVWRNVIRRLDDA